ncbi:MAG: DUF4105 domain-containing protein [Muribaculaceae bacterium]
MKIISKIILLCILSVIPFTHLSAQSVSEDSTIYSSLVTCYPGPEIFELYGHTAIRIQQGENDMAFNYGMFSFSEPNFVFRFVKGDANYILGMYPFMNFLPSYIERGSKVVEQLLNFSQAQNQELLRLLLKNAEPQNRSYRYNYIYDNCSTRPRDLIEKIAGKSLTYAQPKDTITFRQEMAIYNANYPWQQFGIDLALGSGLDYELNYREQMFAPIVLMQAFDSATFVADSVRVPLVTKTLVLNDAPDSGAILSPTPWYLSPMAFAIVMLAISIALTLWDIKRGKVSKLFDTLLYTLFGVAGCVVFFLIFISIHAATSPNMLAFWLNPFCFLFAILIWIKAVKKVLFWLHFINFATLLILLAVWYWLPQAANLAFFPLIGCSVVRSLNYMIINKRCEKGGK